MNCLNYRVVPFLVTGLAIALVACATDTTSAPSADVQGSRADQLMAPVRCSTYANGRLGADIPDHGGAYVFVMQSRTADGELLSVSARLPTNLIVAYSAAKDELTVVPVFSKEDRLVLHGAEARTNASGKILLQLANRAWAACAGHGSGDVS